MTDGAGERAPLKATAPQTSTTRSRLTCLDETRALAIVAMIGAHFAPALFARVPALQGLEAPVLFMCRFATPAFIFVFGVTVGFVYFEKFCAGGEAAIWHSLKRRAVLLALCVVIIRTESLYWLAVDRQTDPRVWLLTTYSILTYYLFAVLCVPLWLRAIRARPIAMAALLGMLHWFAGGLLAFYLWRGSANGDALTYTEVFRCFLVSGSYAYLPLSGTALLAIPLGIVLRKVSRKTTVAPVLAIFLGMGIAMTGLGWLLGRLWGEFSIGPIVHGFVKAPPRFWYFLFFSGQTLAVLGLLGLASHYFPKRSRLLYPMQLFGQASLPIYPSHALVLPGAAVLNHLLPWPDVLGDLTAMTAFIVFCLFQMLRKHKKMLGLPPPGRPVFSKPVVEASAAPE